MNWNRVALLLFPALVLLSVAIDVFGALSVPLLTSAALLVAGSAVLLGLVLGGAPALLAPVASTGRVRQVAFVLALAAVVVVLIDVAGGGHRLLEAASTSRAGRLGVLAATTLLLVAVLWAVRRHAASLLFLASLVFFASTAAVNPDVFARAAAPPALPPPGEASVDRPPLVYIVLDAGMGIEGLAVTPGGATIAGELRQLFARHGFRLHGGAFSRHFVSARSIPNALNFDFSDNSWGPILRHQTDLTVMSPLFDRLMSEGYDVVSYTTRHIDFCFPGAARCEVLPSFNPFSPYVAADRVRLAALLQIVWSRLQGSYLVYNSSGSLFEFLSASGWPPGLTFLDTHAFPRWFDQFAQDVASSPRGRAFFGHFLVPHSPFVFDAGCRETGTAAVADYLVEIRGLRGAALDRARADGYASYHEQYRCVARTLDSLLSRLDELPHFDDATIVIQGDHGSRISGGQYAETQSERDMIDNYSALYAIRRPGVAPGYDARKTSVQRLTAEYFSGAVPGPDELTVAMDSKVDGNVVVRPMPDFGAAVAE